MVLKDVERKCNSDGSKSSGPRGIWKKNELANQKSWLMWRCHAGNGGWWDELHLPMVVEDLTATPEMKPFLYVFLSISQCSKEEAEDPARSQDYPVRPHGRSSCPPKSPGYVFEHLSLPLPSSVRGGAEDITRGFHRAHTAEGKAHPEVQG